MKEFLGTPTGNSLLGVVFLLCVGAIAFGGETGRVFGGIGIILIIGMLAVVYRRVGISKGFLDLIKRSKAAAKERERDGEGKS